MRLAWPYLVDGKMILLNHWEVWVKSMVFAAVELASGEMKDLGLRGWGARWLPTGHLVYVGTDGSLMAVRFDARALRPEGTPVALAPGTAIARDDAPPSRSRRTARWCGRPDTCREAPESRCASWP